MGIDQKNDDGRADWEGPFLRVSFYATRNNLEISEDERESNAPVSAKRVSGAVLATLRDMNQFQDDAVKFLENPFVRDDWEKRVIDQYLSLRSGDLKNPESYFNVKYAIQEAVHEAYKSKKEGSNLFKILEENGYTPEKLAARLFEIIIEVSERRELIRIAEQCGGVAKAVQEALDPDYKDPESNILGPLERALLRSRPTPTR